jgi:radical SAM-linked protein
MVRERVRIRFSKQGDLRFIGHRDLMRLFERLFRRAGLVLGMSQGFHPKPRMSFPSALAVGIEGRDEVMELELAQVYDAESLIERLAAHTVPGLEFRSVEVLPPNAAKARVESAAYQVSIPPQRVAEASEQASRLLAASTCPIQRPRNNRTVDLRPLIEGLAVHDGVLSMRLAADPQAGAQARDVLKALRLEDLEREGMRLTRTEVRLRAGGTRPGSR